MIDRQAAADVLMIRPASFCSNTQTAESNRFQQSNSAASNSVAQNLASTEFNELVMALRNAGVRVHAFDDTIDPQTPDALFPNNWVSFHADGTAVLYPMMAPNRRLERRADILLTLSADHDFILQRVIDLSHYETQNQFLEGTGSMVLDRINHIAYACISPRTNPVVLAEFARKLSYELIVFDAQDQDGVPIYHTNVLLSIGTQFAVICIDVVRPDQRAGVMAALRSGGRRLIQLSLQQMQSFAGNMLELATDQYNRVVVLSTRAASVLTSHQHADLHECSGPLITASIPTIEDLGGGSVRCMLAELHLPRKI